MSHQHLEYELAYQLIASATDSLEQYVDQDDLEAAVIAVLATSIEIASGRLLKPVDQLYLGAMQ
jgi:hypothetical protein